MGGRAAAASCGCCAEPATARRPPVVPGTARARAHAEASPPGIDLPRCSRGGRPSVAPSIRPRSGFSRPRARRESVIPVLQAIQARYRYLPDEALRQVCEASEMTPAQIAGVATFYGQFRHTPAGEHIIRVCEGTACHVSGAGRGADRAAAMPGHDGRRATPIRPASSRSSASPASAPAASRP